ncbi:MAG: zf-HC2 domain-containing protein [Acidobacteriota bacterium]|nr:zf-HC2 domain-containing protein [Acidobacteriota bacterium]
MKETWDKAMLERTDVCARAEDLVTYLYGEAGEEEARDFERHSEQCAACREELAAFGDVREAIGAWRDEALGSISSPAFESNDVTAFASARETYRPKRSALAAIREFFSLSPLWMRLATAAIALVFCVLAFIAIAHFREQPKGVAVIEQNRATPVQERKNEKMATTGNQSTSPQNVNAPTAPAKRVLAADNKPQTPKPTKNGSIGSQQLVNIHKRVMRRNLNESDELVENDYLPFTAPSREVKLPSLADLADEPNQ